MPVWLGDIPFPTFLALAHLETRGKEVHRHWIVVEHTVYAVPVHLEKLDPSVGVHSLLGFEVVSALAKRLDERFACFI